MTQAKELQALQECIAHKDKIIELLRMQLVKQIRLTLDLEMELSWKKRMPTVDIVRDSKIASA